jgi:hypothetical protein
MKMEGEDNLYMLARYQLQNNANTKYCLDIIAGYLISCYVISGSLMEKFRIEKKFKKKLKDSEKLAEYNKYIESIKRK